ncbi:uncharacterized protein [Drosophila pseudoobscura]|uniref:Uncharacterized protein isoform X1 n=1 Tax=Drosophila pseudoobscura pseudoobscura TaxID=46245 RepID=A0A6I8VFF0_DROPS|nr:uncharacterized protein LOC26534142 isoform X1 [Drosophila pseudoobscura]
MSKMMNKIWTQFRGGCIVRGNLIKFNNSITSQIENDLKIEELLTERKHLETKTGTLTKQVRGLEVMVSDLTRAIKRIEFGKDMDLRIKVTAKKAPAEKGIESSPTSTSSPSNKKKITQCR